VVVGVVVPVAAAIIPVQLGTRAPVREALTPNAPLGRAYGTSLVDRALARFGGTSRMLLLALRNLARSRLRVALTLVTLAVGGIFFMSALNLRQSLISTIDRLFEARRADLVLDLASDYPVDAVERAARRIEGVSAAEAWVVARAEIPRPGAGRAPLQAAGGSAITVLGLPADSQLLKLDLSGGEGLDGSPEDVVVNTESFVTLGRPMLGREIRLIIDGRTASLRLAGVAREPFAPAAAYVSRAFFDARRTTKSANSVRVALVKSDPDSLEAVRSRLDSSLELEGIRALQATTKAESRFIFDQHMVMIYVFLVVVSCILGAVGALGLVTTVSLNVTERRRELGILRAIGATPARVAQILVIEGMAVGTLGWLAAAAVAGPLSKLIGDSLLRVMFKTGSDVSVAAEPAGVLVWLVVSLAGSALASLWPALQASRASVREALMYE